MKTILYATDCTENDAKALKYAYRFSCIMKAELHVLRVYQFPPINLSTIQSSELVKKRMQQEQKDIVTKYCADHLKNEFRQEPVFIHATEQASIANGILDTAKKLDPDLVILGMKDSHSNRGLFSGNIANAVLDKIETPLLMVPNGIVYNRLSTIVYASDFEQEDLLSIKKLIEIARPFNALIEVVHIHKTDTASAKERMDKFKNMLLKQVSYPEIGFKTIASSKIKQGLVNVLNNEKANMLAMLERNRNVKLTNLFYKDLIKDMGTTVAIPILAFNKGAKIKFNTANAIHNKATQDCEKSKQNVVLNI
ncbi:universal stress protein [Gelatiniphilus marinus]|uniref:Universal stress protein n=1 Tax=Gelatiniphilus marinus TaxID=1759464 RepID=A0ABW5JQY3_9FLAO